MYTEKRKEKKKMITANEAKEITKDAIALGKKMTTLKVLNWCATCEESIIANAKKGYMNISFKLPLQFIETFFNKDDLCAIVEEFFTSLEYRVVFYSNRVLLAWA